MTNLSHQLINCKGYTTNITCIQSYVHFCIDHVWLFVFVLTGGPYGVFAGHDASRALATFSLDKDSFKDEYDDLADLDKESLDGVREWEMQFTGTFIRVANIITWGGRAYLFCTDLDLDHQTVCKVYWLCWYCSHSRYPRFKITIIYEIIIKFIIGKTCSFAWWGR